LRSPVWIVCAKEVLETARDRRTLTSLLLAPLLGPALFAVLINVVVSRNLSSLDEPLDVPIPGAEHAPNLIAFLDARGIHEAKDSAIADVDAAAAAVSEGRRDVVLVIDDRYGEDFGTARAARVTVIYDRSKSRAASRVERVRSAVSAYGQQVGALRLVAHGVDPQLLRPLIVDELDVSTAEGRSVLMLGVLTYFLLFATFAGGMHLAIDTTAGERERKSLEPLLALPVTRTQLILGKMAATICYTLLALALTLAAFTIALSRMPLEKLGMSASFGLGSALTAFALLLPIAPLGAALMTIIASFSKTYREAQTYLALLLQVPTLPVMFASMLNVEPRPGLMWIPSLSQHLLVTTLIKAQPLDPLFIARSAIGSLALALVLTWVAIRLYRREAILG
jgi:sodium transport system permease protein